MSVYSFPLRYSSSAGQVFLRELNGHDEMLVDETGTLGVLKLLNGIIVPFPGTDANKIVAAEKITVTDRDFLLSGIYQYTYGPQIESSLNCIACFAKYDINFSLAELEKHHFNGPRHPSIDSDGYFVTENVRFRLPTGEDELAIWGLSMEAAEKLLLQRCVPAITSDQPDLDLQQAMEELAPVLFTEMQSNCPECNQVQTVSFDIQSYLINKLKLERKRVAAEIHCLATAYGWAHKEILDLPRSLRKTYAGLVSLN